MTVLAVLTAVCTVPSSGTGPDRSPRSDISAITWTDGQPADAIKCDIASSSQTRTAVADGVAEMSQKPAL